MAAEHSSTRSRAKRDHGDSSVWARRPGSPSDCVAGTGTWGSVTDEAVLPPSGDVPNVRKVRIRRGVRLSGHPRFHLREDRPGPGGGAAGKTVRRAAVKRDMIWAMIRQLTPTARAAAAAAREAAVLRTRGACACHGLCGTCAVCDCRS